MASNQQSSSQSFDGVSNANAQNHRPESPYYIDPNETPVLEATLVLSGPDNYSEWYRAISMALASKNKLGFVDGAIAIPAKDDPINGAWKQCNDLVLSWIVKGVSPEIANSIHGMDKAVDVWTILKKCYSPGDLFIISDILDEIHSLSQGQQNVTSYFEEFNLLWKELEILRPQPVCNCEKKCSCGALQRVNKQREEEKVARFLKGLDDRFAATRSRIMREDPLPPIGEVYTLVMISGANQTAQQSQPPSSSCASNQLAMPNTEPGKEAARAKQTACQSQGLKQHRSQPPSSSNQAIPKPQPEKELTRTEKLVLPCHPHPLTLKPPGEPYRCSGCQELGFGPSYCCENNRCYVLHEACANAVVDQSCVRHPFFSKSDFSFLEKPLGYPRVCGACRKEVLGFVYHCNRTGHDLHPCCLKLEHFISNEEENVTLQLHETIPAKCLKCKNKKVENAVKVKGWSYVSLDGQYRYHVSCFKELIVEKYKKGYFSKGEISMQTYDLETQLARTSKEMVKAGGRSRLSGKTKKFCKIVAVVFQLIFSVIFGDPTSFFTGLVEAVCTD